MTQEQETRRECPEGQRRASPVIGHNDAPLITTNRSSVWPIVALLLCSCQAEPRIPQPLKGAAPESSAPHQVAGSILEIPPHVRLAWDKLWPAYGRPAATLRPGKVAVAEADIIRVGQDDTVCILVNAEVLACKGHSEASKLNIAYGVIAHELAHVQRQHPLGRTAVAEYDELVADEDAGRQLAALNLSIEDATASVAAFGDRSPSASPAYDKRIAAVQRGWRSGTPIVEKKSLRIGVILSDRTGFSTHVAVAFRDEADSIFRGSAYSISWRESCLSELPNAAAIESIGAVFPTAVDYLVTVGTGASVLGAKVRGSLPQIFLAVTDPVGSRLVESLDVPRKHNVAGTNYGDIRRAIEALYQDTWPTKRFVYLYSPQFQQDKHVLSVVNAIIAKEGAEARIVAAEVGPDGQLPDIDSDIDIMFGRHFVYTNMALLRERYKLPIVGFTIENLFDGALLVYGPSAGEAGQIAARDILGKALLQKRALCDIPILEPSLKFGVNSKMQTTSRVSIPMSIVEKAWTIVD